MSEKKKIAFYWCASCGGCDEAVVDLNETLLAIADAVEIVLWPLAMDFKYKDIERMEKESIAVSFINGAIRTEEQVRIVKMLKEKSKQVMAFGSCAHMGGIPGLANLSSRSAIFESTYHRSPTVENSAGTVPLPVSGDSSGKEMRLPVFYDQVFALDQVVDVDCYLPGCPPMPDTIQEALTAVLTGTLPEKGAVLSPNISLCDGCARRKTKKPHTKITKIVRPHEIEADPDLCFLEQGIICMGPATRTGCGEVCILGNMPCTGCYGPLDQVTDQGAKMLTALASLFDAKSEEEAAAMADQVPDPAGTFSRYSVPKTYLAQKRPEEHPQ